MTTRDSLTTSRPGPAGPAGRWPDRTGQRREAPPVHITVLGPCRRGTLPTGSSSLVSLSPPSQFKLADQVRCRGLLRVSLGNDDPGEARGAGFSRARGHAPPPAAAPPKSPARPALTATSPRPARQALQGRGGQPPSQPPSQTVEPHPSNPQGRGYRRFGTRAPRWLNWVRYKDAQPPS